MEDGIEQHLSIMTNMIVKQKIDEENRIKEPTNEILQKETKKSKKEMNEHKKEKQD